MLGRLPFRMRLLFCFWGLLLLALLLLFLYYRHALSREILTESRSQALGQLNLVYWLLEQEHGFPDADHLQRWTKRLSNHVGARITYVARGGKVVADSEVPFPEIPHLDNHAGRPEIIQALNQDLGTSTRYSATLERELIYVARRVQTQGSIPAGVIRLAIPFSEVKNRLDLLARNFIIVLILTFAATIVLSYVLVRQVEAPVRRMIHAAEAIGNGDYNRRIRLAPGQEFGLLAQSINQMAERIQSHIQTITGQKQQLQAILDGMAEGVMVLDSEGKIRTVNPAFTRIVPGVREFVGRRPLEVIRSSDLQQACDQVLATGNQSRTASRRLEISPEEGQVFDVNIVKYRDRQEAGGAIIVFHDISELKRLERVRRDFVANISHELRTPLTSIRGYAETLLADGKVDSGPTASFLDVILENARQMTKMIEDLLQLARLEGGQQAIHADTVDANEALRSAWSACDSPAGGKPVRLENQLAQEGVKVRANADQLIQVFRNLLENAVRYSPSGGSIRVFSQAQGEMVLFGVEDEGPGIPKQAQSRVFERFYRVEKDRGEHLGSTGLGLAICRHIILNHGGRIWVESPAPGSDRGALFRFSLPRAWNS